MSIETVSETKCFGGNQGVYTHDSEATGTPMTFAMFVPEHRKGEKLPVLWWLSGLTCTHENAMIKCHYHKACADHGVIFVCPDTSPRGEGVPDDEAYDFGQGAGFYVNATQDPWAPHFRMWDYIATDLPALLAAEFPLDMDRQGITGHSMGGHGALTLALTLPDRFRSVSAFAPIANPTQSDWGRKQLGAYLGEDSAAWEAHDSTLLMTERGFAGPLLVDQGTQDQFLDLLKPEALAHAIAARRQPATFRMQAGYDHSYFFVASFMRDHIDFHAEALRA